MAKYQIKIRSFNHDITEKVAAGAITPGHLIELTSADKVQVHSTAGGAVVVPMFALEDANQGRGITDAYASTGSYTRVKCWYPGRGDEVYATISATSAAVTIGAKLESAGDGTLRVWDAASSAGVVEQPASIVGVALEAISAGSKGKVKIL